MDQAQICFSQVECTNCPIRKNCAVRLSFYSENYAEVRQMAYNHTLRDASTLSIPTFLVPLAMSMMDHRRQRELELHPTYSAE